jgi:hypothetical protein
MQRRLILPLLALVALVATGLALPAGAGAKTRYKLGFGDQSQHMFANANFKALKIKQVRLIVPWDYRTDPKADAAGYDTWLRTARADGKSILVAFAAHRGCYDDGRYKRTKVCRAPSAKAYTREFKAFRKAHPYVKQFQPWNELNNKSQPTYRKPGLAARYYVAMKKTCRSCTVVAADILDSSDLIRYVTKVKQRIDKAARGRKNRYLRPRIWGLHNYSDVNRKRTVQTKQFLRKLPGQVWLTETGGLVKFLPNFKSSQSRAANRTKFLFKLAGSLSKPRRGYKSRITRVYPYAYFGYTVAPGQPNRAPRFDSGLVGPLLLDANFAPAAGSGKARPAYRVFKRLARKVSK